VPRAPLPVDEVLPALTAALAEHRAAVLTAPTGAGKTTRVPPAVASLLADSASDARRVVMLEPRRIAARAAARRIAEEGGWRLGDEVGYQVRFDRRASADTRILVVTEGLLVQRLQSDPFLEGVGAVVFDEFHERSLDADLALAMAARVQREVRPDLLLTVMSATLDAAPLARFLGGCPAVESRGFLHPVEIDWLDPTDRRLAGLGITPGSSRPSDVSALAAWGVRRMLERVDGDVLCFLPGVGEIHRTAEALEEVARARGLDLAPLHGSLPPAEQDAVLSPSERRRVVLATNVAETSVTIEGIEGVVDSGWVRQMRFDPARGLDKLELVRISRASAAQRTGRAGRLGPGRCLRLWSEHEHRGLAERTPPEVARVDLAGATLQLLAWGESDAAAFPWYEAPDTTALAAAEELLARLGAVEANGVTALGRAMAALPAHPRLARLLAEGHRLGHAGAAAMAAALLGERFPIRRRHGEAAPRPARSDLLEAAEAVERFSRGGAWTEGLNRGAARFALQARDQLASMAGRLGGESGREGATVPADEAVLRAAFAAFPDRLCRRREPRGRRAAMVGGRGVELDTGSAVTEAELFVALELAGGFKGAGDARARLASAVDEAWLPEERVREATEVEFDPERQRVIGYRRRRYLLGADTLLLDEREVPLTADLTAAAEAALAAAAAADLEGALPLADDAVASFLARLGWLAAVRPELALPEFGDAALTELLPALVAGRRSFAELAKAPLLDVMRGLLTPAQLRALEREAPERLEVPSGNRIRLDYAAGAATGETGRPPVLAVRIQEMFGLAETPRVGGGRVPVLLHLLAPNHRPQQVTDDLASFWQNTYPEVRKELAGRYPKHAWPEDPLAATPRRRPGRR